jgi:hypothetical protein
MIILAHISQEANTREKALAVTRERLRLEKDRIADGLVICAAGQYEMIRKGEGNEEMDPGTVCCFAGMEYLADDPS